MESVLNNFLNSQNQSTYNPACISFNLIRTSRISGRISGSSSQHDFKQDKIYSGTFKCLIDGLKKLLVDVGFETLLTISRSVKLVSPHGPFLPMISYKRTPKE